MDQKIIGKSIFRKFYYKIKKYYKKQAFHPSTDTAIVKASLLNDAGIYGAAKLAL